MKQGYNEVIEVAFVGKFIQVDVFSSLEYGTRLAEEKPRCSVIAFNDVPVIAFKFSNPESNFFIHLNFGGHFDPDLLWMSHEIQIKLTVNFTEDPEHPFEKIVWLNKKDSKTIALAFAKHVNQPFDLIEASIESLYDNDHSAYEWLY